MWKQSGSKIKGIMEELPGIDGKVFSFFFIFIFIFIQE